MASTAFTLTKWSLGLATRFIKADARIHNVEAIRPDMAIIFVVNHFTRLETLLLPYLLHKKTGLTIWSLAAGELFVGRLGRYMNAAGAISTKAPDRDKTIVHSLLKGDKPWIIFPEGAMIKDKKVVDQTGMFSVYNQGHRRPPHTGAAVLALRAEYYRQKLHCLRDRNIPGEIAGVLDHFSIESVDDALAKRTCIIPVNVTYFPIRAHDNALVRMARLFAKDLSPRAVEELSVEGTVLSEDTDIDITLGDPIEVKNYLDAPEYAEMMACSMDDYQKLLAMEEDPTSAFADAARRMMFKYMSDIYRLTTVNYDHLTATLLRHQGDRPMTEAEYRTRVFLCAHRTVELGQHQLHGLVERTYRETIYDEPSPKLDDFLALCVEKGLLKRENGALVRVPRDAGPGDFHLSRMEEITDVIANEIEPMSMLTSLIKDVAKAPRDKLDAIVRDIFIEEDQAVFDEDYAKFHIEEESKPREIGRPFLVMPTGALRGGIVLTHGYLAAPEEVRALAEFLCDKGYAVYGVRLRGHGTSPEDLAQTPWEAWYESLNRGYAVVRSLTDNIILGGFSTGGILSLLAAANKGPRVRAVFSISAPLALQNFGARFAPTLVSMNALIKRVRKSHDRWEFVVNNPENKHINYFRNPLAGVRELSRLMDVVKDRIEDIRIPAYVMQGSRDPIVKPGSAQMIFDRLGTPYKELCMLERDRHGIVNGDGARDVYDHIVRFLAWAHDKPAVSVEELQAQKAKRRKEAEEQRESDAPETAPA